MCPDCGEPITVEVKDGVIVSQDPGGLIGYSAAPFSKLMKDAPST
ncbi:MAG TPA: hypothetical protein VMH50_11730 [Thermoleophilia bacterium]|nr:hypothetical protein [Thermoleophilia bacterium]